jgi:16S rRNA C967 or C1407 C5-methylase (RsmB/RsmF family)
MVIIAGALKRPMGEEGATLQSLVDSHAKLLHCALTRFPDVQRVVYCTRSANIEENEKVVEKVLARVNTAANPVWGLKCFSTKDFTPFHFIALMEKLLH